MDRRDFLKKAAGGTAVVSAGIALYSIGGSRASENISNTIVDELGPRKGTEATIANSIALEELLKNGRRTLVSGSASLASGLAYMLLRRSTSHEDDRQIQIVEK